MVPIETKTDIECQASDLTHRIAHVINKKFDFPVLTEDQEEEILINVIDALERFNTDRATSNVCRWIILFLVYFAILGFANLIT